MSGELGPRLLSCPILLLRTLCVQLLIRCSLVLVLVTLALVLLVALLAARTVLQRCLLLRLLFVLTAGSLCRRSRIFVDVVEVQRCLRQFGSYELRCRRGLLCIPRGSLIALCVAMALILLLGAMVLFRVHDDCRYRVLLDIQSDAVDLIDILNE